MKHTKVERSGIHAVAGVGGGTLLLLLAKSLPDGYEYKSTLILIAPTASVVLANFWQRVSNYIDQRIIEKQTEVIKEKYRKAVMHALNSHHITPAKKALIIEHASDVELRYIDFIGNLLGDKYLGYNLLKR